MISKKGAIMEKRQMTDKDLALIINTATNLANWLGETYESVSLQLKKFGEILQQTKDAYYKIYVSQGAVYGETEDGFERWLNELSSDNSQELEVDK